MAGRHITHHLSRPPLCRLTPPLATSSPHSTTTPINRSAVLAKYAGDRSKAALLKYVAEQRGKAAAADEDEVDDGEEAEEAPKDEL